MDIGNEMRVIDVEETVVDPERIEVREPAETATDPTDSYPKPI